MSPGHRAYYTSRSLAIINLFVTPRNALSFLYPSWIILDRFSTKYRYASTQATDIEQVENCNELRVPDKQLLTGIDAGQESNRFSIARRPKRKPTSFLNTPSPSSTPTHCRLDGLKSPGRPLHGKDPDSIGDSFKSAGGALLGFKSLEAVLLDRETGALKSLAPLSGIRLEPARIRRLQVKARRDKLEPVRIQRVRTKAQGGDEIENNGAQFDQNGTWSYDWQLPLLLLKQYYRHDSSDEPDPQSRLRPKSPNYHDLRARDIPQPAIWSSSIFVNHIKDLMQSSVSRVMHRYLYPDGNDHANAVHIALMLLFEDPSMRVYLTPRAFNIAMMFLYKHGQIASVRRLFNLMDELRLKPTVETFNIMLRGAASQKDLHNFTMLLRVMIRRGVSPNSDTWVTFLVAVVNDQARVVIFRSMKAAGVLNNSTALRAAVGQLLHIEVADYIASGQTFAIFMEHMTDRYGKNWLSLTAGNTLCHLLGENGLVSEAFEALEVMSNNICKPDNVTLHIFIGHCMRLRRPVMALKVLLMFHNKYGVYPTQDVYDMLFMLAWRSQRMNCCKVIWQVACVEGRVSWRMQQLVLRSLLRNRPNVPTSNLQNWLETAGNVIVGVDLGATIKCEKLNPGLEVLRALSSWVDFGKRRQTLRGIAGRIVKRDLNASRRFVLDGTFLELLSKALEMDSQWELEGKRRAALLWKIENSVEIKTRAPSAEEITAMSGKGG